MTISEVAAIPGAFPKILAIGDRGIATIFDEPVEITEKIDGSQFGFGVFNDELICRSKGRILDLDTDDKLFAPAVRHVRTIADLLPANIMYYAETLAKPKHSTLKYERIPRNHIVLFGAIGYNYVANYPELVARARDFDIDVVPLLHYGRSTPEHLLDLLNEESYLGGQKVEGAVVKNYKDWLFMGRIYVPVMCGKFVSERFKETHRNDWGVDNTTKGGLEKLKDAYRSDARWRKAVQALRERDQFEGSPRDIGALIKEVKVDLVVEEEANIKEALWDLYRDDLLRASVLGLPEWFKESLALGEFA